MAYALGRCSGAVPNNSEKSSHFSMSSLFANMKRILVFLGLSIFLLIAGIFMMDINIYMGMAAIGIGAVLSAWCQMKFVFAMIKWTAAMGEENRKKRQLRKVTRNPA